MKRLLALIAVSVVSATLQGVAVADERFYRKNAEGWFWYKDPKEAKPKEEVTPPVPEPQAEKATPSKETPSVAKPQMFSVAWLRTNIEKLRDIAIDDPTKENVSNYYYAQRVMLDKADKFASVSKEVVTLDPDLDENNNFPYATAARTNLNRIRENAKAAALKTLAEKAGIWFFFDSKCTYCQMQVHVAKHLAKDYGFLVTGISTDGENLKGWDLPVLRDQGQFRLLNLSITPTLVLVVPPKTFLILSQGILAESEADDRILTAAATQQLLPEELSKEINMYSRGVLQAEDINKEATVAMGDDPKQWVGYLRNRIRARK